MRILLSRRAIGCVVALLLLGAMPHAQTAETAAAEMAVTEWLLLVDEHRYAESWTGAATMFKQAVTQQKWEEAARAARTPLGAMTSRKIKAVMPTKTLPGAPDGEYVVVQYDSVFERKASAVETVTAILEPDGTWHVGGYFIK